MINLSLCAVPSVVSDSLQPCGLYPAKLLCPWDFPGNDTGVSCHALLQGIFPNQGWNPVSYVSCIGSRFFTTNPTWEALTEDFVAVGQSFGHVHLFETPWTIAHQASLSFTMSPSLLKLMPH